MKQLFTFLFICTIAGLNAQNFSAMTYNIRVDVQEDGENAWPERKAALVNQIHFFEPAILGTQEGTPQQIKYLRKNLNGYNYIGKGRNGGRKGEFSAIFYNSKKLEVLKKDTFWLSDTPDVFSTGWDAALPRICTYGKFRDKNSGTEFWVFNTHFDHLGEKARSNSAQLILQKIKSLTNKEDLVILMGDLNATPESNPIAILAKSMMDSANKANVTFGPENTFNGFKYHEPTKNRIDYIFVSKSKKINIKKYAVLNNSLEQRFISDHFPVIIEFQIK
jgi:endonuclease/exonuclease/phosphatase family metal-dependent hydrolase